jgi:hypothetical protein
VTVGIATTRANDLLNTLRNVTTNVAIATPFVQLHTGDPGAAGTANISVGSTTRNAITWNAPASGLMTLLSLGAWTNGGTSETITHVSLWTASTAGTFIQAFTLTASQAWVSTNTLTLPTFTPSYIPLAA